MPQCFVLFLEISSIDYFYWSHFKIAEECGVDDERLKYALVGFECERLRMGGS